MYRIAHLSDLHFGAEIPAVVAALAAELERDPPDLVAISGDLTMRGRSREFRAARALAAFARQGVRLVLSGHLHVGDVAQPAREAGAAAKATAARTTTAEGPLTVVLSATTTSRRLRGEPNAFNEIRIGRDGGV